MEVLHYDIRVTLHQKQDVHDTFQQKSTSTLNVQILVNPLSILNVKDFYIKSNIFTLRTGKCKKSTLSVKSFYIKGSFTLRVATRASFKIMLEEVLLFDKFLAPFVVWHVLDVLLNS